MTAAAPVKPIFTDLASQVDFVCQIGRGRNVMWEGVKAVATFYRIKGDTEKKFCALEIMPANTVMRCNRLELVKLPYDQHTALDQQPDGWTE